MCECEAEEEERATKGAKVVAAAAREDAEQDEGQAKTKKKHTLKAKDYVRHLGCNSIEIFLGPELGPSYVWSFETCLNL